MTAWQTWNLGGNPMLCPIEPAQSGINHRRAFTLVEMILVVSLIVIALGFGGVRFIQMYHDNEWDHSIKKLTAVLRFVQMKAVQDSRVYALSPDSTRRKFTLKRLAGGSDFESVRSNWLSAYQMGPSLQLEIERGSEILFYPDGTSSAQSLRLHHESGKQASLRLKNRIGTVEVSDV